MDPDKFVAARVFQFPDEAKLARAVLESNDIACYLEYEHAPAANWSLSVVLGGLRLLVRSSDLARAEKILAVRVTDDELARQAEAAAPLEDQ